MAEYPQQQQQQQQKGSRQVVKAATAITIGGSLLVLSGLILTATVIGLTLVTPLLVIFSPVLVPAGIVLFLLLTGFLTSGGFGVAAISVLSWIHQYMTGKHPPGSETLEQARKTLASKAREMREKAEKFGHQQITPAQG